MEESVDYAENTLDYAEIFGSLRSPKLTSFHAAEIELPLKPRVCSQVNFKQKKITLVFWFFQLFSFVFGML